MTTEGQYRPRAREDGLYVQPLEDEILIYDDNDAQAHSLDKTVARVWSACDGTRDLDTLCEICDVDEGTLEVALEELRINNLLDEHAAPPRMTRKKLLGTAIALPVIVSVAAPTAAMAAGSCGTIDQSCVSLPCCPGLICVNGVCQANPQ